MTTSRINAMFEHLVDGGWDDSAGDAAYETEAAVSAWEADPEVEAAQTDLVAAVLEEELGAELSLYGDEWLTIADLVVRAARRARREYGRTNVETDG